MTEQGHKIVYLIVERGTNGNRKTYWRALGVAYPCRDGSLNLKLDIHPGLTFNIRDPKSIGEREETQVPEETEELDEFNNTAFPCEQCKRVVHTDEAHALYNGGAVCEECAEDYKSCGRCDYYFPKTIRGTHCPKCSSSGSSSKGGGR
jgi:hypothetical protein